MDSGKLELLGYLSVITRNLKRFIPDIPEEDIRDILTLSDEEGEAIFNVIKALNVLEDLTNKNNPFNEAREFIKKYKKMVGQ
ncbi:hypothetical protein [Neobacillus sp. DY30]|uniref:hypothetical protein n=1 Tax=Neobacillus sp. DY30 TaxID=3047871 RepID=UPI0024BF4450|nr:hypothetical protein [Neobacillus sp. DY30]WHX98452.1 hypothetical protein QNH29_17540 [Neobacillus sp. DY30]